MASTKKDYQVWIGVIVATVLWFIMFSPLTSSKVNFWYAMTASAIILTSLATIFCREWLHDVRINMREVAAGLFIALILWCVFWIGDKVSGWMFSFERPQVDMIYAMKNGNSPTMIALLLLLIIGPAEEIFWRGFIQRRLMQRWGANAGFFIATICYTAVHIPSLNFMLIMAALVVGFCWGVIYRFFPQHLTALIISHAVWDTCAFVLFPF